MGDRIAVLDHGEIAQIGSAKDIYLKPVNNFVADFIGQMNRLEGSVGDGQLMLDTGKQITLSDQVLSQVSANKEISVMLRPEDILLTQVTDENSALTATVISTVFLGDRTRVTLSGLQKNRTLMVDCFARVDYQIGQVVIISFAPERLILLKK